MKPKLLFLLLIPFLGLSQTQIGLDIDGEAAGDRSGYSVSLSSDGSTVAIGAPYNSGGAGHVRVFENQSSSWVQIGTDIDGEVGDQAGFSVSLSSDGSIVAIGAYANETVRVYENQSGVWTQIGQNIVGNSGDKSGYSVSISSDGSKVAIGANANSGLYGTVSVYENLLGVWTQIGQNIVGEGIGDFSGESISLSSDGSIVAIGADENDGVNGDRSGHVRVYKNQNSIWTQIGQDIDGKAAGDRSGESVSISNDGSIVAIGAPGNNSGYVRVYKNQNNVWTQIGQDIDGESIADSSGFSVSLSSDGSIVAISAPRNDGNGSGSGHVRIYKNQSGTWTQIGQDIDGEYAWDFYGRSVSLSSDGSVVAIGANENDVSGAKSGAGHVRIHNLGALLSTKRFSTNYFNIYPNPIQDNIYINLKSDIKLKQANIYSVLGEYLYSEKSTNIDVSNLSSGLYILEIETNNGKSSKKILKE